MERAIKRRINKKRYLNEVYIEVQKKDFKDACIYLYQNGEAILRTMFATDERQIDGTFKYMPFSPSLEKMNSLSYIFPSQKMIFLSLQLQIIFRQPTGMSVKFTICSALFPKATLICAD